jgi:hypothetical protein
VFLLKPFGQFGNVHWKGISCWSMWVLGEMSCQLRPTMQITCRIKGIWRNDPPTD